MDKKLKSRSFNGQIISYGVCHKYGPKSSDPNIISQLITSDTITKNEGTHIQRIAGKAHLCRNSPPRPARDPFWCR